MLTVRATNFVRYLTPAVLPQTSFAISWDLYGNVCYEIILVYVISGILTKNAYVWTMGALISL